MKSRLIFKSNKSLRKLAKETIKSSNFKIAYRDKYTTKKCFYLVKDDGIYLMEAYESKTRGLANGTVVYASGFNPNFNDDIWEKSYAVSSDDFAENIYFTDDQLERIANGGTVTVTLAEDYYEVRA
jgi:hypothetical protein